MDALNFVQVIEILNSVDKILLKKQKQKTTQQQTNKQQQQQTNKQTKRTIKHSKTTQCPISFI